MMRRILICIAVCSFLWCSVFAEPATVFMPFEVSTLTDDQLYIFRDKIEAEIAAREQPEYDMMYQGIYTVGEHIDAGTYLFIGTGVTNVGDVFRVYSNFDDYKQGAGPYIYQGLLKPGEIVSFTLDDGMLIDVFRGAFICRKQEVKPGWAK